VSYEVSQKIYPEDGRSVLLRNVGILPHLYTVSKPRRSRLEKLTTSVHKLAVLDLDGHERY